MIKVLFICKANICRSPMAHGVMQTQVKDAALTDKIFVDSAGTHSYHIGVQPDHRAKHVTDERGYDLSGQKAQLLTADMAKEFDYLVVMDSENFQDARLMINEAHQEKLVRLLDFTSDEKKDVPDPFFSGSSAYGFIPDPTDVEYRGFKNVLDMIEIACANLLKQIRVDHGLD